ncbi:MAG TPA: 16S rRNA (cytosine(1402)-N(4))-methyltransferase RsmH [Candidatus Saccharimonadales bacterium]|nr:16S rRNA (cytosine(1402)-N(4))-methyltransferase RsmH [Candidatus Saccharimonadales bacterium]
MKKIPPQQLQHEPVLLQAVLDVLKPQKGERYLDLTAGYGGHAKAVINLIGAANLATLVDRDETSIKALQELKQAGANLIKSDYGTAAEQLHEQGEQVDLILIDLGVSSPQLDIPERGFSFMRDGPLDMRMDQQNGLSAAEYLNQINQDELTQILREYGEEPKAKQVAQAIIANRPFATTAELAGVVADVYRGRRGKTHPATRTFQAIRIAVNDELGQLKKVLPLIPDLLKPGGRVAIISFHSLEDRLVKRFFKEQAESGYEATLSLITKRPISGATEDVYNPRSRSAKLRGAVKIKNKRE